MIKKRSTQLLITLLINVLFFYLAGNWVYHNVNFGLVLHAIGQINKLSILILSSFATFLIFPYALRMAKLLDDSTGTCFKIIAMGFGFNALLPFRIGDVVKIYFTKRFFNINIAKIGYASVIEKLFDIGMIGALGGLFALQTIHGNIVINALVIITSAFTMIYLVQKYRHLILKLKFIPKDFSEHLLNTMDEVLHNKKFLYLIGITIMIWVYTALKMYTFFKLNLPPNQFHIIDAICLIVITTFALSIPSTPASIGVFESGIVFYLTHQLHIPADQAVAYAVVLHLGSMLPQIASTLIILTLELGKQKRILAIEQQVASNG